MFALALVADIECFAGRSVRCVHLISCLGRHLW